MSTQSNPLTAPASDTGAFWSIERIIAWIVGPIVSAGSGWLALFLANNVPGLPTVSGEAIYALAGTATLSTAALFHKWLHGRQVMPQALLGAVHTLEATPMAEGFIKTSISDLEGLAQSAANKAAEAIKAATPAGVGIPPPAQPIQPAANDPAPSTAVQGQAADAGAATVA